MNPSESYLPVIGLEIHAELKTSSKMFCSCKNDPDEERPNTNVCPICLGHPGTLPVLNHDAIRKVLKIGCAVGGSLADFTEWDRKNYFYPDIPKGYQISQYKFPLVSGGSLGHIAIERIHLEEDTAQSTHDTHEKSLVNFNRSGVPLMELVTKPVIHDAVTAVTFARELQLLLRYLDAGEANLEKGEMRVEANISVGPTEEVRAGTFGTKTEVKNLNSFRAVERAIAYEIDRQTSLLRSGGVVRQETRGWDENAGETFSQRSKESSHDYRYFPDPDIPKLKISEISEFDTARLERELPELPWHKRERYKKDFGMSDKEVAVFVETPALADYFESIIATYNTDAARVKLTVNYLLTDYLGLLKKEHGVQYVDHVKKIPTEKFADMIDMLAKNELSSAGAKSLLYLLAGGASEESAFGTGTLTTAYEIAREHKLLQQSNAADLAPIIDSIITAHPKAVTEYKSGKIASLQFLIGQAMRASKGSANPATLRELFVQKLG